MTFIQCFYIDLPSNVKRGVTIEELNDGCALMLAHEGYMGIYDYIHESGKIKLYKTPSEAWNDVVEKWNLESAICVKTTGEFITLDELQKQLPEVEIKLI